MEYNMVVNKQSKSTKKTNKAKLKFRLAKAEEMDEVWRLDRMNLEENWNYFPATTRPMTKAELIRHHFTIIDRWFDPQKHRIVVALLDEKIVGIIWYTVDVDVLFNVNLGFLFSIVVDPEYRGLGIGKKLLREFKNRSKRAGAKYVRLAVLHNNIKALNLYRQMGFFDDTHYMLARLEPTAPEKAKQAAKKRKALAQAKNKQG